MNVEKLSYSYLKYELTKDDVYKHQYYIIITRSELTTNTSSTLLIHYDVVNCEPKFCVVKATAKRKRNY